MLHDRHFFVFQRLEDRVLQPPVEIVQHRIPSRGHARRRTSGAQHSLDYFGFTATKRLFPCRLRSRTASSSFLILCAAF